MFSRHLEMWALGLRVNFIKIIVRVMEWTSFLRKVMRKEEEKGKNWGVFPNHAHCKDCIPASLE